MSAGREQNIGRLTILKERRREYRIEIDAQVKALIYHFEPFDNDCVYCDKIEPFRVESYSKKIVRTKADLDRVNAEIKRLEKDLGEDESVV